MRRVIGFWGGVLATAVAAPAGGQAVAPQDRDPRWELAARLVADSLLRGPGTPGEVIVVQDSASARLLRSAGVPVARVEHGAGPACPRSTDAAGAPLAGETGYLVTVELRSTADSAEYVVDAGFSCRFVYRGRARGFAQGRAWAIRREGAAWRVARSLGGWVT